MGGLQELLRESDVVSLHSPLFSETEGVINAKTLAWMKPSAFLINTSRGSLVVDRDLAAALNGGRRPGCICCRKPGECGGVRYRISLG